MSTEESAAPIIEVPPKDEVAVPAAIEEIPVETNAAAKVNPVQRLNSVFNKAKQSVTAVVSDAQKALTEKKQTATATETTAPAETTQEVTNNKVGGPNNALKDILNRFKGRKPTSTHPAAVEEPIGTEEAAVTSSEAPAPPPKDTNTKSSASANPIIDQLKRNTTLLTNYLLSKKKDFTEKKSSDNNEQQTTTPEVHDETVANAVPATHSSPSPLVRRITQLVNNATATLKREPKKKEASVAAATEEAPVNAAVPATTEETPAVVENTA